MKKLTNLLLVIIEERHKRVLCSSGALHTSKTHLVAELL